MKFYDFVSSGASLSAENEEVTKRWLPHFVFVATVTRCFGY